MKYACHYHDYTHPAPTWRLKAPITKPTKGHTIDARHYSYSHSDGGTVPPCAHFAHQSPGTLGLDDTYGRRYST